ncbi:MAG: hypothetical protein HY820_44230, partial [Acidobacteria bacterium]|nr:hypothetical protein [Acidobacteriota bacterium]
MGLVEMGQHERILDRILSAEHVLAMFDYDGTLAPFTVTPEDAHLPAPVRSRLKAMLQHARITAGVLSGRALA